MVVVEVAQEMVVVEEMVGVANKGGGGGNNVSFLSHVVPPILVKQEITFFVSCCPTLSQFLTLSHVAPNVGQ